MTHQKQESLESQINRLGSTAVDMLRRAQEKARKQDEYIAYLRRALYDADRLFNEALPKFNWGASALDANAIMLLNEVPGMVRVALEKPAP